MKKKSDHILGDARYYIVIFIGASAAIFFFIMFGFTGDGLLGFLRMALITTLVFFSFLAIAWFGTEEVSIIIFISSLAAALVGFIIYWLLWENPILGARGNSILACVFLIPFSSYLIFIKSIEKLSASKWIGDRCPKCKERGTTTATLLDKRYLGTHHEYHSDHAGRRNVRVEVTRYMSKYLNMCKNCKHEWEEMIESSETHW